MHAFTDPPRGFEPAESETFNGATEVMTSLAQASSPGCSTA
jgi:hypothetical protein